ncbi:MAG: polyprenyl synthetase family protein [Acidimicrobiales bacterium]
MAPSPLLGLPGMEAELVRVEEALRAAVVADDAYLTELATHLIAAGGKRLRPALTLAAGACGRPAGGAGGAAGAATAGEEVVRAGVAVELIHLGSLYHDDVMDEATTRRGVASVNSRWGNLRAILAGDFLLARASSLGASLGREVSELLATTLGSMCAGQIQELQTTFDLRRDEDQYLTAIAGKTAALFATACRCGALVTGLAPPEVDALTTFGHRFGMAFQIVDDVLDVVGSEEQLGKPAGNDLAEGVYTLPVILALASPVEGPELTDLLGRPLERTDIERARKLVRSDGAVIGSMELARLYCAEAVASLSPLRDHPSAEHLATAATSLSEAVPDP